jgi:hypothetical protein
LAIGGPATAAAAITFLIACKSGEYDGSYDGSFDGGAGIDGSTVSRLVQPEKLETFASADGVMDVTFAAGTFTAPATITITSAGEQTLDTGLIVPIYVVASDKPPAKFFQVSFHGNGTTNGGPVDRVLVPAMLSAGTYQPLAIDGAPNGGGGGVATFWGLTKTFGTFSLVAIQHAQGAGFAETASSCTSLCCGQANGSPVSGFPGGCLCASAPSLACFLEHCADLDGPAARCSAIAAASNTGNLDCKPFGAVNCPGPGCPSYSGMCGSGGGGGGGPGNNASACCILNKNSGSCVTNACPGFAARCTANTACPLGTSCCVFDNESYCAKDCPQAQRACASNADCTDAGTDGGTCQGGGCPVAVCGTPPVLCR